LEVSPEYVAGFFDAEGHVTKRGYVQVSQVDPAILVAIQVRYGGRLVLRTNKKTGQRCYYLHLRLKEQGKFFSEVAPYSFRLSGVVPMRNHPSTADSLRVLRSWQKNGVNGGNET